MMPENYAKIAEAIDVDLCGDWDKCGALSGPERHKNGFTDDADFIHWTERRVTRSGVRRFLMLAWKIRPILPLGIDTYPVWMRLWLQINWTRKTADKMLHVAIPPKLWAEDKARLAAKLAWDADVRYQQTRQQALRWTQR